MKPGKDAFRINNKHESLFCCGRRGVNYLIIASAQFFYLVTILYLAFKLTIVNQEFAAIAGDSTKITIHSVILAFAIILLFYIWFGIVPSMLTTFALTSNIEMMKDRHCIYKVVSHQRMERSKRSFRIYQVLKLIRREMIVEFRKKIPDKKLNKDL